jgi:hypothetical protein
VQKHIRILLIVPIFHKVDYAVAICHNWFLKDRGVDISQMSDQKTEVESEPDSATPKAKKK